MSHGRTYTPADRIPSCKASGVLGGIRGDTCTLVGAVGAEAFLQVEGQLIRQRMRRERRGIAGKGRASLCPGPQVYTGS